METIARIIDTIERGMINLFAICILLFAFVGAAHLFGVVKGVTIAGLTLAILHMEYKEY